jgi:hypothetical protein
MKTAKWILALSIMMLLASQTQGRAAGGYYYSGNDLVGLMREDDNATANAGGASWFDTGRYNGYILGVREGTSMMAAVLKKSEPYDIPDNATRGQIVAVVSKYLKDHPEKWSESAVFLVTEALMEAFPLKGGK